MRIVDASACSAALKPQALIAALRTRFALGCVHPHRHVHTVGTPQSASSGFTSLIMPAWVVGECFGIKVINIAPGNSQRGLPGLHAVYTLFDANTGVPLAQMDGNIITAHRTAAASALAADFLAAPDASHLLLVGAGRIAALLPAHHACVRPLKRVSVWARRLEQAQALALQLQSQGFDAQAVSDLSLAARSADIVSSATLATEPIVQGAWLKPGSHLDLIGSFTPSMREADDDCFSNGARLWVDIEEAFEKSGDLLEPMQRQLLRPSDAQGTLASLCNGAAGGRRTASERTVFKSVGCALEDLAAAMLIHGQVA